MRDAATAMLDANVAYWRYATLQEPVVLGKMYQAADKVYIELQRARSETKDPKAHAAIDGLLDLVQKMNDVIDATKEAFDKYLKLDRERNVPLRAQLEDVIAKISSASDTIAHQAEASVVVRHEPLEPRRPRPRRVRHAGADRLRGLLHADLPPPRRRQPRRAMRAPPPRSSRPRARAPPRTARSRAKRPKPSARR